MMQILAKDTPLISKKLIAPWRLASWGVGLLLLIMGSFYLPSADWDIPICFVMGIPAYVLAPWSFRQVYYLRLKWMPLAATAFWLSVDGTYWMYWGICDPDLAHVFRPANFFYCTPIFWVAGVVWNLDLRGMRLPVSMPLEKMGEAIERRMMLGMKSVVVVFLIVALSTAVGVACGLVKAFPDLSENNCWPSLRVHMASSGQDEASLALAVGRSRAALSDEIQKAADKCVELDPATKEWVPYMAKGRARSVGSEGFNADDFDDGIQSVSMDWMKIEIQCDDGSLKTNDYVVSYQAVSDEGLVVSNFNSKAVSAVFELMNLAEKKFGVGNSH